MRVLFDPPDFEPVNRTARSVDLGMIGSLALFAALITLCGCKQKESVLFNGEGARPVSDGYREVLTVDDLTCGYRTSGEVTMQYQLDAAGAPRPFSSGTLDGLHCSTGGGPFVDIDLASTHIENGKIETKRFGTIRTDGSNLTAQPLRFLMTDDQIIRIRSFVKQK